MGRKKKSELRYAHKDGYRVRLVERPNRLSIFVCLIVKGKVLNRKRVWKVEEANPEALWLHIPEWNRRGKLLAALLRSFNEGGSMDELSEMFLAAHKAREKYGAEIPYLPVAVQSEETHVRTFLLADGNYLRVIEDEVAEVITPEDMQRYMREEAEEAAETSERESPF